LYARVINIRYPPGMRAEVVGVAHGLPPILKEQRGFNGLLVLTDPSVGEGIVVSLWEAEADAKESETNPSYIGQMSMMSSFLSERLAPETYQVDVQA
jgi:heme-degrading monooxygenase HmoA